MKKFTSALLILLAIAAGVGAIGIRQGWISMNSLFHRAVRPTPTPTPTPQQNQYQQQAMRLHRLLQEPFVHVQSPHVPLQQPQAACHAAASAVAASPL